MTQDTNGIVGVRSSQSVEATVDTLKALLAARGVTLFALVDHSGEAAKAGLEMRPTKLLIFGSPRAGTPLMLAAPGAALDLPLKLLVWEDGEGQAWISYNDPVWLQQRHSLPAELLPNIAVIEALAARAAEPNPLVGVFARHEAARRAVEELRESGLPAGAIQLAFSSRPAPPTADEVEQEARRAEIVDTDLADRPEPVDSLHGASPFGQEEDPADGEATVTVSLPGGEKRSAAAKILEWNGGRLRG